MRFHSIPLKTEIIGTKSIETTIKGNLSNLADNNMRSVFPENSIIKKEIPEFKVFQPKTSSNLFLRKITNNLKQIDNEDNFASKIEKHFGKQHFDEKTNFDDLIDDDLTNLSWLQDANLLRNIQKPQNKNYSKGKSFRNFKELTNNCINNQKVDLTTNNCEGESSLNFPSFMQVQQYLKRNNENKPPYSFSVLIFMAIDSSPCKKLPVKGIYDWILEKFPYFRNANSGWKNSIRHNLSLNKCFKKLDKDGASSHWYVDPFYRPLLLQTVKKLPYHPYGKIQMSSCYISEIIDGGLKGEEDDDEEFGGADSNYNVSGSMFNRRTNISKEVEYDAASTLVSLSTLIGPDENSSDLDEKSFNNKTNGSEHSQSTPIDYIENFYGIEVKDSKMKEAGKVLNESIEEKPFKKSLKNKKLQTKKLKKPCCKAKTKNNFTILKKRPELKKVNSFTINRNININVNITTGLLDSTVHKICNNINNKYHNICNQSSAYNSKNNNNESSNVKEFNKNYHNSYNINEDNNHLTNNVISNINSTNDQMSFSVKSQAFPMLAHVVIEEQKRLEGIDALLGLADEIVIKSF